MLDPLKEKHWGLYWRYVLEAAQESVATRHKVGAVVVTPEGMISPGWNGMPSGMHNECEYPWFDPELGRVRGKTKPEVIHAERNAIDKMTRQGIPTAGAHLFVTRSPCFECAKAIHGLGFAAIHYGELHDCTEGLDLLEATGNTLINGEAYVRQAV